MWGRQICQLQLSTGDDGLQYLEVTAFQAWLFLQVATSYPVPIRCVSWSTMWPQWMRSGLRELSQISVGANVLQTYGYGVNGEYLLSGSKTTDFWCLEAAGRGRILGALCSHSGQRSQRPIADIRAIGPAAEQRHLSGLGVARLMCWNRLKE